MGKDGNIRVEKKNEDYQLSVYDSKSGLKLQIHGASEKKAGRGLAEKVRLTGADFLILIGMGMGFWVNELLSCPSVSKLVVIEPNYLIFKASSQLNTVRKLFELDKVELFVGDEIENFIFNLPGRYELLLFSRIEIHTNELLGNAFLHEYLALKRRINKALNTLINDGLTISRHSLRWMGNFVSNLRKLSGCSYINSIYDSYDGTAVLVGAGPSVDEVLSKRDIGNSFIISTDAGLRSLFARGYTPNLIVTLDPQPHVMYHFKGMGVRYLQEIPCAISLLSYRDIFDLFYKKYIYFTNHPISTLFDHIDLPSCSISRESVISVGFDIAVKMGFKKIIIIGCDFSYPRYRAYSLKSFFYLYNIMSAMRFFTPVSGEIEYLKKMISSKKNKSEPPTSRKLLDYREELEKQMRYARKRGVEAYIYSPFFDNFGKRGFHDPFKDLFFRAKKRVSDNFVETHTTVRYKPEVFKKIIDTICLRWNLLKKEKCPERVIEAHFLNLLEVEK